MREMPQNVCLQVREMEARRASVCFKQGGKEARLPWNRDDGSGFGQCLDLKRAPTVQQQTKCTVLSLTV